MDAAPKVLVVDDEPGIRQVLLGILAQEKIAATAVENAQAALKVLEQQDIAVMVTDIQMPGMDGLELLERVLSIDPTLQVILITAHGTADVAARAWELGAAGYVRKPFERDEIVFEVRRSLAKRDIAPAKRLETKGQGILSRSAPMKELQQLIARIAPTDSTVLIRGESGTGKELVARTLHASSPRAAKPFIKVVCAALPEALLESELFGYEKGAFTGAAAAKPGRFDLADTGTLFLDEIGDLTPATQVKLLRVLQDRQFERVGGVETRQVDVRVLTATHRDLEALVREGKFREDLYYRINVVPMRVPPLRERPEDIPFLAMHFVTRFGAKHGRPAALDPAALSVLQSYPWPGNVRELQNIVERLVLLSTVNIGEQAVRDVLPAPLTAGSSTEPTLPNLALDISRGQAEKTAITKALASAEGNRSRAATLLGISRRTLYNKLREHDIG